MVYWARRATINDGSLHGGLLTVINAVPLAADDPRLAANFIHFYVARGLAGFEKVFAASGGADRGMALIRAVLGHAPEQAREILSDAGLSPPADWQAFFFPDNPRPVYLYLDMRLARTAYWWHWFGTWDVARSDGRHAVYRMFANCRRQGDLLEGNGFSADLAKGRATVNDKTYPLQETHLQGEAPRRIAYGATSEGLVLVYHVPSKTAGLMQPPFDQSLFSRLFLLKQTHPGFFSLQSERFPYYQVWRVHQP